MISVLCLFGLSACRDGNEPALVAEEVLRLNAEANQVVFNLQHFVTARGVRRAEIKADTAFFLEDKAIVELRVVEVTFFDHMGEVTSILTSRDGTYDWNSSDMVARNDVVVENPAEGRTIKTSVLHYQQAADRIWSDAPTEMIEADGAVIRGTAFESNPRMDRVDLTSPEMIRRGTRPEREP